MNETPLRFMLFYDRGDGFRKIRTYESSVISTNRDQAIAYLRGQAVEWKANCPDKFGTGRFVIASARDDDYPFDRCERVCSA